MKPITAKAQQLVESRWRAYNDLLTTRFQDLGSSPNDLRIQRNFARVVFFSGACFTAFGLSRQPPTEWMDAYKNPDFNPTAIIP